MGWVPKALAERFPLYTSGINAAKPGKGAYIGGGGGNIGDKKSSDVRQAKALHQRHMFLRKQPAPVHGIILAAATLTVWVAVAVVKYFVAVCQQQRQRKRNTKHPPKTATTAPTSPPPPQATPHDTKMKPRSKKKCIRRPLLEGCIDLDPAPTKLLHIHLDCQNLNRKPLNFNPDPFGYFSDRTIL